MELFFRILSHLLPDSLALRIRQASTAWRFDEGHSFDDDGLRWDGQSGGRTIDRFWQGIASFFGITRTYVDLFLLDAFTSSTRDLDEWEFQYGLIPAATDANRRANIAAAKLSTGGQGPGYLQDTVQAAGFDLYIHEWFDLPGAPLDPRTVTVAPLLGLTRCGSPDANCGNLDARCNAFLLNDPLYFANKRLVRAAPPPIPADSASWPYFLYWGAETFPDHAEVPSERRQELERLLLRICGADWLVVLVDYV